jgi:hypothetical protein
MAKKTQPTLVLTEEAAKLIQKLGKDVGPSDAVAAFEKQHPNHGFTESSLKQAVSKARRDAGFTRGKKANKRHKGTRPSMAAETNGKPSLPEVAHAITVLTAAGLIAPV